MVGEEDNGKTRKGGHQSFQSRSKKLRGQVVSTSQALPRVIRVSVMLTIIRLAHTESRLILAKLLWHFDLELDGLHDGWVEASRFFVSASPVLNLLEICEGYSYSMQVVWELKPLIVRVTPATRS